MRAPAAAESFTPAVSKASWRALIASWLGWMFDGFETYALVLVMTPAVHQLLPPERLPSAPVYIGGLLAATMVGWAAGGVAAGVITDYVGRRRTLMLSILCYAVFAGLAAISWDYWSLLVFRFLTGLGLGAEWGPGAAIVAEFWPPASRGRAGGALHAAHGVGFLVAAGTWLLLNPLGPSSWRFMFVLGILPALLLLYVRRWVDEPTLWIAADRCRREARTRVEAGSGSPQDRELAQFTLTRIVSDPELRRRVGVLLVMSITTVVGWWSASTWIPDYARAQFHLSPSLAGLMFSARVHRGFSYTGYIGRHPGSQANDLAVLPGSPGILAVLVSGGARTTRASLYDRGRRVFQQRPIRMDDDLSARTVSNTRAWHGNVLGFR